MTRWPRHSTWPLFDSTKRSTEKLSCAVEARIPLTLFAAIAIAMPVPQVSTPRSAAPSATLRARRYVVTARDCWGVVGPGPRSQNSWVTERGLPARPIRQLWAVSYTHLRAHETRHDLVCRLLLEKKNKTQIKQ